MPVAGGFPLVKLDQYEQRTQAPTGSSAVLPRADAPIAPYLSHQMDRATENLGAGLRTTADVFARSQEEQARAWSADIVSDARLQWTQQLEDRKVAAEPGADGFSPTLLKDYDEYANKTLETAPTMIAKQFLHQRLQEFRTTLGEKALTFEAQARLDYRNDKFVAGIQNIAKLMNTDPAQYTVALAEQLAVIDSSYMPPIQKSALRQKAVDTISSAAVWSQIQKSPTQFLTDIGFMDGVDSQGKLRRNSGDVKGITGNTAFDALPFEKRTTFLESAVKLKAANDADVDRLAAKEHLRLQDDTTKTLWKSFFDGTLKPEQLEAQRPILNHSEYFAIRKAMEKPEAGQHDDPETFRRLQSLIANQKYDDAVKYAFDAHRAGDLSNATLRSETQFARTVDRQEGPKSPYERGKIYITNGLDPGPYVKDPEGKVRFADAQKTFDTWMQSGKHTDQEITDRASEIVNQYKFVDMSNTAATLPLPRVGIVTRQVVAPNQMIQQLTAAGNEAVKRYNDGRFTRSEYEAEMGLINQWRKLAEKSAAAQAAKKVQ